MNILILGGTGYVGGILKGILSSKGHNIEIVGQSTKKNYKIGEEFDESNLENIDYLFYLSWMQDTTNKNYQKLNISSLKDILEKCNRNKIKLIFFSTFYASEDSRSMYNKTKAMCEKMVISNHQKVVRLGSVIVDGYKLEGFYGKLKNFSQKYKIFPVILPNKKLFFKTNLNELSKFSDNFDNLSDDLNFFCSKKPLYLIEILNIDKNNVRLIPVPWYLIFFLIKFSELIKLNIKFRSDSVLSIWGEDI